MYGKVKKIDFYTNKTIKEYQDAQRASMINGDSVPRILNQCRRRGGVQNPQQDYYYRFVEDEPTPHSYIAVYDLDFNLVGKYFSIQDAEEKTGVMRYSIGKQLQNKLPLKERKSPTSGLYFIREEVN